MNELEDVLCYIIDVKSIQLKVFSIIPPEFKLIDIEMFKMHGKSCLTNKL